MTSRCIPPSFPRSRSLAMLAGAQPKLAVRHIDGVYTDAWSELELSNRYEACIDMVEQLTGYTRRKLEERPQWPLEEALRSVEAAVRNKGWGFTELEIKWMVSALRDALV